jgi:hypothetical protein
VGSEQHALGGHIPQDILKSAEMVTARSSSKLKEKPIGTSAEPVVPQLMSKKPHMGPCSVNRRWYDVHRVEASVRVITSAVPGCPAVERLIEEAPKIPYDAQCRLTADKLNTKCGNVELIACTRCPRPRLVVSGHHTLTVFFRQRLRPQVRRKPDLRVNRQQIGSRSGCLVERAEYGSVRVEALLPSVFPSPHLIPEERGKQRDRGSDCEIHETTIEIVMAARYCSGLRTPRGAR